MVDVGSTTKSNGSCLDVHVRQSPISAADVGNVRQRTQAASLLPPRVYHDPEVFAYEQEAWFADGWICVGREEDIPLAGHYFLTTLCEEQVIVVRDNDGSVRAFFNFCRHRGAKLVTEERDRIPRFQCPYHAWVYDLNGRLHKPRHCDVLENFDLAEWSLVPVGLGLWQGLIFLNITGEAPPLLDYLADMPDWFDRFDLGALRRVQRIDYDVLRPG
jgi:phenylpropionate dioxygenase-like ring-hydroxylating dioxygenase large terminal subunit